MLPKGRNAMWNFMDKNVSGLSASTNLTDSEPVIVPRIPLYAILKALGNPVVDFFSLDTNYREADVLRTIPWDLVNIKGMAMVEISILESQGKGGL